MAKTPTGKTPDGKNTSGRGQRDLKVKVKSARGRKLSSTRWLQRQLNDPYVKRANAEGYRGRAAYKILELDEKYRFLVPGARVVDLGAAPGGWCQVAVKRVNALGEKPGKKIGTILGIDLQEMEPIAGCELHQLDFMEDDADEKVKEWLGGKADVVMSDMAAAGSKAEPYGSQQFCGSTVRNGSNRTDEPYGRASTVRMNCTDRGVEAYGSPVPEAQARCPGAAFPVPDRSVQTPSEAVPDGAIQTVLPDVDRCDLRFAGQDNVA